MEREYKSIIDLDLIDKFPSQYPHRSFFNYVSNLVGLEGFISVAGILMPDLVERDGCIFLKENYVLVKKDMSSRFGNDHKTLERYVNLFCLSDYYMLAADEASQNEYLLLKQAEIIRRFWEIYLKSLFPNKVFEFEISTTGLFDEDGVCLTFSQI